MRKNTYNLLLRGSIILLTVSRCVCAEPNIQPAAKRAQVIDQARKIAQQPAPDRLQIPDGLRNPFDPAASESKEVRLSRPANDKDLLSLLADQLQPTGVMGRDDSMVLLLKGQKGVKLNEKLTVSFDGSSYEVEVTAIDRVNFTIRYNQAEVTRPIKPGKNP